MMLLGMWWACRGEATLVQPQPPEPDASEQPSEPAAEPVPDPADLSPDPSEPPCEIPADLPGQDVEGVTTWEGRPRTWHLHVPADYDCTPRPLVIGLHYYTGEGHQFEHDTARIHDELNRVGAFGLFPDAVGRGPGDDAWVTAFNDTTSHADDGPDGPTCAWWAWDYSVFADCPRAHERLDCHWGTSCADDAGLVRQLVHDLQAQWTLDERRIFLTGFSQGAIATQGWGCELADLVAAIAPIHGFAANGYTCGPEAPVSMMQVWGRYDLAIDGQDRPSLDGLIYDAADETAAVWAAAQGCAPATEAWPTVSDGRGGWACEAHPGCATGADVVSCRWDGIHIWGRDPIQGDFTWRAVWEFFESHPKPR